MMTKETVMDDETRQRLERHIKTLRSPYRNVDRKDWEWIMEHLGDSGHGKFWKEVLTEVIGALEFTK